jgi:hypothetical protein
MIAKLAALPVLIALAVSALVVLVTAVAFAVVLALLIVRRAVFAENEIPVRRLQSLIRTACSAGSEPLRALRHAELRNRTRRRTG